VPRADCSKCLRLHGTDPPAGVFPCKASQTDEKGQAVCVFCADNLPCPLQIRRLAQSKAALRMLKAIDASSSIVEVNAAGTHAREPQEFRKRTSPNRSTPERAKLHVIAEKPKENQKMPTVTSPAPTSIAAAAERLCTRCKQNPLSYNNSTGICGECQRKLGGRVRPKKTNGHIARPHRGLQLERDVAKPSGAAKPKGADHRATPSVDGGAAPRDRIQSLAAGIESRVELLLAAVPVQEKTKMLAAWMAGTL
jgi:hypothetical protein